MYQRQLTNAFIRLSNDETVVGDVIDEDGPYVIVKTKDDTLYIRPGAILYIREENK